jgi:amino acid transporter
MIFPDSVKSTAGATVMGTIVLLLTWACATGIITTASRMTWSFARDRGTPFSSFISYVSPNRKIPVVGVGLVCILAALLNLIYIGSSTAFNDVISLTITGFYCSYFLPAAMLLYRRIKGHIAPHQRETPGLSVSDEEIPSPRDKDTNPEDKAASRTEPDTPQMPPVVPSATGHHAVAQAELVWGPFRVPGLLGTINNAYACVYMLFVIFWSVWPPETPVTYDTMNYSVLVTGGVIIFSIIWYFVKGRKEYSGPLIDDEVAAVMRLRSIVDV